MLHRQSVADLNIKAHDIDACTSDRSRNKY
jgi:hypothetical protein